jgi:hypothetical protein
VTETGIPGIRVAGDAGRRPRVLATGGERTVPAPDAIARDYLLLALRLDQRDPGLIDGYFGPADLKAQVDLEQASSFGRLRESAAELHERLQMEVAEPDRRAWLDAQLVALETLVAVLDGEPIPYLEQVTRCYGWTPTRRGEGIFDAAAAELDRLLPGDAPLDERLAAWDDRFVVDPERLPAVVDWLVGELRARARPRFGVPDGDSLRVGLVRGQPWSGYNWYDGGLRSRVDLNVDLPVRVPDLLDTLAHETYGGHHLEHASREVALVEGAGHLEASALLLLTPECLLSEGLADVGPQLLVPPSARADLLAELFARAGLAVGADRASAREAAERVLALAPHRRRLAEVAVDAALLRWVDGADSDETLAYLRRFGRLPVERARKRLEFIEHPRWRTYVHVYYEGEPLVRRWIEAASDGDRDARFRRLLSEPLTPGRIAADLQALRPATEPGDQSSRTKSTRSSPSNS